MAVPERTTPRAATSHDRSIPPPSPGCTAATPWLLPQAVFALTRRRAAAPQRRAPRPQTQIEPFHKRRVARPAAGGQDLLHHGFRAEDHTVLHLHDPLAPHGLDHLRLEEPGQGLSTICQPQFINFPPPSARPAHDESGSHHSTSDDAAWP